MILRATKRLNPFAVRASRSVDVLAYVGRSHKTDSLDGWIRRQGINGLFIAVDHVENTIR